MDAIRLSSVRFLFIKRVFIIFFFAVCFDSSAQIPDSLIRPLKGGRIVYDNSPVYRLPYKIGTRHLMVQGWQSSLSHKNEVAQDFKMKVGTPIYAARDGVVTQVKSDGKKAGLKDSYLGEGNNIVIQHSDTTYAGYWHLNYAGVFVSVGDSVNAGDKIGISGHTGYSAFPHLHFMVFHYKEGERKTIPVRFLTKKGARYLRPGKRYKAMRLE